MDDRDTRRPKQNIDDALTAGRSGDDPRIRAAMMFLDGKPFDTPLDTLRKLAKMLPPKRERDYLPGEFMMKAFYLDDNYCYRARWSNES